MSTTIIWQRRPARSLAPTWFGSAARLSAGLIAILLASCGGGGGGDDDGNTAAAPAAAATAPSIKAQPESKTVTAPASVTFAVVATGSDPLVFQWQKNGTPIPGATASTYTTDVTAVSESGATFSVIASNALGSVESSSATLTIQASSTTGPAVSAIATDYLLTGLVDLFANGSTTQHHYVLYLVDRAHLEDSKIIEDFGADQPLIVNADAFETDGTAHKALYRGAAQTLYVKNRKLWAVDLVSGLSHVPRQVSSANVCGLKIFGNGYYAPVDSSAREVWVEINDCSNKIPTVSRSFVKSSMTATEVPSTIVASGSTAPIALSDENGRFVGSIVQGNGQFDFYDRNFVRRGLVAGSEGLNLQMLGFAANDYSVDRALYLTFDNKLYRLVWTDISAGLKLVDTLAHNNAKAVSDSDAVYLVDGLTVLKVVGDTPPTPVATFTGPPIALLRLTDDRIIVQQSDGLGNASSLIITSIAKAGAPLPVVLAPSNAAVIATTSDSVFFSVDSGLRLIKADGRGEKNFPSGRVVYDPLQRYGYGQAAASIRCIAATGRDSNCSNGIIQETLLDGTVLTLGQVSHAVDYRYATFGSPTRLDDSSVSALGLPELITFHDATLALTDLYVWRHGTAGSLVRLTNNVP